MKSHLPKIGAILWKDILYELRTKDIIVSVAVFVLLVLVIFSFAFDPRAETVRSLAPGIVWVAFSFAGVLGLNRSFVLEKEKGCLDGLLLCPVPREVIFLGKMLGSFVFMVLVELLTLPIFSVLFNISLFVPSFLLIALLATLGFVAVGSIFSAVAVNTKSREIMLSLLFFPIVVPVIIAAVSASGSILQNAPFGELRTWFQVLAAFDVIFLVVSSLTFEYAVEE